MVIVGYPELGPLLIALPPEKLSKIDADPQQAAKQDIVAKLGRRVVRGLGLTAYLRSPAALVLDAEVSRQDMIAYVANKLGGAHFDSKRGGKAGQRLALLDKGLATYDPSGGPVAVVAFAELLSIAEALAESSDAARFRDAFLRLQPPERALTHQSPGPIRRPP